MAQIIKNADIFGRLGTGIGKGLSEQVPKEIERSRLASGLEKLGNQQGLTPFQQFSKLSSIPGITPQMIQSGSDLLRQQAQGQALKDFQTEQNQPQSNPFNKNLGAAQSSSNVPSITQEKPLEQIQEGYIPPTKEQEFARAGQLYNANPAQFANNPQKALDFVSEETQRNNDINKAYQQKHQNLSGIQDNVVKRLQDQSTRLNTKVPAELYSKIEDEAIQATKSKKEGGKGLTEQQAMKEYGDKLNDASRDFAKIDEIGNWSIIGRSPASSLRSYNELQKKMENIGQTDNFAKQMISKNKLSPQIAYAIAEPVKRVPGLSNSISQLPRIDFPISYQSVADETRSISPKLAEYVKNNERASPLAIAYELGKMGYSPDAWLKYLTDHPELNLRQRQSEQASTPINILRTVNDIWLSSFTGLE